MEGNVASSPRSRARDEAVEGGAGRGEGGELVGRLQAQRRRSKAGDAFNSVREFYSREEAEHVSTAAQEIEHAGQATAATAPPAARRPSISSVDALYNQRVQRELTPAYALSRFREAYPNLSCFGPCPRGHRPLSPGVGRLLTRHLCHAVGPEVHARLFYQWVRLDRSMKGRVSEGDFLATARGDMATGQGPASVEHAKALFQLMDIDGKGCTGPQATPPDATLTGGRICARRHRCVRFSVSGGAGGAGGWKVRLHPSACGEGRRRQAPDSPSHIAGTCGGSSSSSPFASGSRQCLTYWGAWTCRVAASNGPADRQRPVAGQHAYFGSDTRCASLAKGAWFHALWAGAEQERQGKKGLSGDCHGG